MNTFVTYHTLFSQIRKVNKFEDQNKNGGKVDEARWFLGVGGRLWPRKVLELHSDVFIH